MTERLRIRFVEERQAVAFVDEFAELAPIEVGRTSDAWEVSIDGLQTTAPSSSARSKRSAVP